MNPSALCANVAVAGADVVIANFYNIEIFADAISPILHRMKIFIRWQNKQTKAALPEWGAKGKRKKRDSP